MSVYLCMKAPLCYLYFFIASFYGGLKKKLDLARINERKYNTMLLMSHFVSSLTSYSRYHIGIVLHCCFSLTSYHIHPSHRKIYLCQMEQVADMWLLHTQVKYNETCLKRLPLGQALILNIFYKAAIHYKPIFWV